MEKQFITIELPEGEKKPEPPQKKKTKKNPSVKSKQRPAEEKKLSRAKQRPAEEIKVSRAKQKPAEEKKLSRAMRGRKRFFLFLEILLGIVIALILAVLIIYVVCPLENVEVSGTVIQADQTVEEACLADQYSQTNTVYAYFKNKLFPVTDISFVDTVDVKIKDRNTLELIARERTPLAVFALEDGFVYCDETGTVTDVSPIYVEAIAVTGLTPENAKVGDPLPVEDYQRETLATILQLIQENQVSVWCVQMNEDDTYCLYSGSVVINLGTRTSLDEKIRRLPYVLPDLGDRAGTLHLENWTQENTDIVFEMQ